MIECPWCTKEVVITDNICPECKHEVLLDYLGNITFEDVRNEDEIGDVETTDIESILRERFTCTKCGGSHCDIKEVAMTGTGLSKILDVQYNHFLFVSCMQCGYVEIYNPNILAGKNRGSLGTIMDILFGN